MAEVMNRNEFQECSLEENEIVLVDFFTNWCTPCKMIAPIIEELSMEMEGKAKIYKVDVNEHGELAKKYKITTVPTLIIFKDGIEVDKIENFMPKDQLKAMLEKHLD